jgi:hypothetical protein
LTSPSAAIGEKNRSQSDVPRQEAGAENCSGFFIFDAKQPGSHQAGFPKSLRCVGKPFHGSPPAGERQIQSRVTPHGKIRLRDLTSGNPASYGNIFAVGLMANENKQQQQN